MGILNVTPDSFSDGGKFCDPEVAVARALEMVSGGADIVDLGGESSRPGAEPVLVEEELRRVLPVLKLLRPKTDAAISIDTVKAEVAQAALDAGADIINDITALRGDPRMVEVVARAKAGVVLMHMQGEPRTMQSAPHYENIVAEIMGFLAERVQEAEQVGIRREQIALDPGIGFGKTLEHNLKILRRLDEFCALDFPLLMGLSRKSFLRKLLDLPHDQHSAEVNQALLDATLASSVVAILRGASIVRVHDVEPMVRTAKFARLLRRGIP